MADVDITFGAQSEDAERAAKRVAGELGNVQAQSTALASQLGVLATAFVSAFSVSSIIEFSRQMAELGAATELASQKFGMSVEEVSILRGEAKLTGTDFESIASGLATMSSNISTAVRDPFSNAAAAVKALGLNLKELQGLDSERYIDVLADAVAKYGASIDRTRAVQELAGSEFVKLLPHLDRGSAEFARLRQEAIASGIILEGPLVQALAESRDRMAALSLSMEGLNQHMGVNLSPVIEALTQVVRAFTNSMTESLQTTGLFASTLDLLVVVVRSLAIAFGGVAATINALGVIGNAVMESLKEKTTYTLDQMTADLEKVGNQYKEFVQTVLGGGTPLTVRPSRAGGDRREADFNPADRQGTAAAAQRIQAEIALERGKLAQMKEIYDTQFQLFQISSNQRVAQVIAATNAEFEAERGLLEKERALWPEGARERETINRRIVQLEQQHQTELLRINRESLREQQRMWGETFNALQSSFNSQLRGLLAGTTSWAQAFKTIMGDMVIYFIQAVERMVVNWIVGQLAQVTATQEAEAAKVAATAAGSQGMMAAQLPQIIASIGANVARVFSGVTAWLSGILGPAAPAAAAGVAAGVEATALGMLPAAEQGAWEVPATAPWMLHPGETVLPAPAAQAFRDAAEGGFGGGGGSVVIHALDAASVLRLFQNNAKEINRVLGGNRRLNPSVA